MNGDAKMIYDNIQEMKDDIKEYLNTVWSISIIRGFILYVILF